MNAETARELLDYNPETGALTWRVGRVNCTGREIVKAGSPAGTFDRRGYLRVKTGGKTYSGARLIVLLVTGEWPTDEVDHINLDKSDDRWANIAHGAFARAA